jgi:hypothetical protein
MTEPRPKRWLHGGTFLVAVHLAWVAAHVEPAISGPDMGGYFLQAHQLAVDGRTSLTVESPLQASAPHFVGGSDGYFYSKYPPGFPLLLAVPVWLLGPGAALWVDPLLTSAMLLGMLLLGRRWLGPRWALLPVLAMAVTPLTNQHALGGFAHTAAACLLVWSLYGLARWEAGEGARWAACAGLFLGLIPTARYAEALFVGGVGLVFVLRSRDLRRAADADWWRGPLAAAIAAAVPLSALAIRNQAAFGAFWRTGYSATQEQTGFSWASLVEHWHSYLVGLAEGNAPVFGLAVLGLGMWLASTRDRRRGLLIVALVVPTTLLYCAYYWRADGMSQRFLLPIYPLLALVAVVPLRALVKATGVVSRIASAFLLVLLLLWGMPSSQRFLEQTQRQRSALVRATDLVSEHVEPGSVLFVDRSVAQQLMFAGDWCLADAGLLDGLWAERLPSARRGRMPSGERRRRRAMGAGDRAADAPAPMAGRPRSLERFRGLRGDALRDTIATDLARWAGTTAAHVLIDSRRADDLMAALPEERIRLVAELHFEGGQLEGRPDRPNRIGPFGPSPEDVAGRAFGGAGRFGRSLQGTLVLLRWEREPEAEPATEDDAR